MSEDLVKQLDSKDIHQRADAGRQLAKVGEPQHIARLLQAAIEDPSPGVRLYAVGAAADILSRYRVGPQADTIGELQRRAWFDQFKGVDPGQNPGVFSVMANLKLSRIPKRLLVGLQDPRLDVRTGAIVGAYRYFISHAAADDAALKAELLKLLESARLRPDAMAAIVRQVGQCGWEDARGTIQALRGRFGQVDEAIELTLGWLDEQADPGTLLGAWASYGGDAGEVRNADKPLSYLLLADGVGARFDENGVRTFRWSLEDGQITLGDVTTSLRRMVLDEPVDHEFVQALQTAEITWYRASKGAAELAERFSDDVGNVDPKVGKALAAAFVAALPDTAAGERVKARVELSVGMTESALERLEAIAAKPRGVANEVWYWLGAARKGAGDDAGAKAAFSQFLKKAKKKDPLFALAEAEV
ncbi:MAG: hypothetical protein VX899_05985 [Myxococcota bacterium]|nr:hypothetical protein [Myxococcota bacterium]